MTSSFPRLARELVELTAAHRQRLAGKPLFGPDRDAFADGCSLREALGESLQCRLSTEQFTATCLDAVSCATVTGWGLGISQAQARWIVENSHPLCRPLLACGLQVPDVVADTSPLDAAGRELDRLVRREADPVRDGSDWIGLFEQYLTLSDRRQRRQRGVYYTPAEVARYIVREADRALVEEFGLAEGLADTSSWSEVADRRGCGVPAGVLANQPFVTILDPALGTGVFLLEAIDCIHGRLTAGWRAAGADAAQIHGRWNEYVPRQLLGRLFGLELMLPALVVAHLQVTAKLAATGFEFREPAPLPLLPANTLADPVADPLKNRLAAPLADPPFGFAPEFAGELLRSAEVRHRVPFTVILGNPPFANLSRNSGDWIGKLLHGHDGSARRADYFEAGGRPLGERKHWLHDDYVKFLRYAHWQVERSGAGIVAMVTNHGYLDNKTFRGMREQLLATFPRTDIVDLHGNRKKRERAPDGAADDNVFGIDSGVAIATLRRPPGPCKPRHTFAELWGPRQEKLRRLKNERLETTRRLLQPTAPEYLLTPVAAPADATYRAGIPLNEAMPVSTTAPVTARDKLVVAFSEDELRERLSRFRDLSIPDETIRRDYFARRRSWRYPAGDTRGWKLAAARRRMAEDADWASAIRCCLYRPFDARPVYWAEWMIDWPRGSVMRHMQLAGNRALIARRQMLPAQPCDYFWICDRIALDGVIRSDNRGSESLFPLYLDDHPAAIDPIDRSPRAAGRQATLFEASPRRVNLSDRLIELLSDCTGLAWNAGGPGDLRGTFGPDDVLGYNYALFHSPTYRRRYAEQLRRDFPRILLPARRGTFVALVEVGTPLVELHATAQASERGPAAALEDAPLEGTGTGQVERRRIAYRDGQVWINAEQRFANVSRRAWEFRVGGHQVCHKWLADRAGRQLAPGELAHYRRIVQALDATRAAMDEIDRRVEQQGGWPAAFASAG